jgi:hypothetical protein
MFFPGREREAALRRLNPAAGSSPCLSGSAGTLREESSCSLSSLIQWPRFWGFDVSPPRDRRQHESRRESAKKTAGVEAVHDRMTKELFSLAYPVFLCLELVFTRITALVIRRTILFTGRKCEERTITKGESP